MTTREPTLFPAPDPLLGHLRTIREHPLGLFEGMVGLGGFVKLRALGFWAYVVQEPELIQEFLIKRAKSFHKDEQTKFSTRSFTPENIFVSDGEAWKAQRKLMQPAFHSGRIGAYADDMVAQTRAVLDDWRDDEIVDVDAAMQTITMRIIIKTMFNTDLGDTLDQIGPLLNALFEDAAEEVTRIFPSTPRWVPTPHNQRVQQRLDKLAALYQRVMDEWRATDEDRGDLLSMLMLARYDDGTPMSDAQIMSELNVIFLAGHETTAKTLTFALLMLSEHPEIAAELHAEVDRVLGGRAATLADLKALTVTEQIIKETLRLYPAALGVRRVAIEDVEIGGYTIPKDSSVTASIWGVQRSADYFPEPLAFKPQRWTPEFEADLPRYAYLPFGGGPRVCIGNQFALMEAQLVLATLAQRYMLHLQAGVEITPRFQFTLHPGVDAVPMRVQERQPALV